MTLDSMQQLLIAQGDHFTLVLYLLILMSTSYGFPFSSDLLLIIGGSLASMGYIPIQLTVLLSPIAIYTGDTFTFLIGRKFGIKLLDKKIIKKIFPIEKQNQIRSFLQENARKFIFGIRFIPGMRSLIFLTAGSMQIPKKIFFQMNALSTGIYAPFMVILSFYATNRALILVSELQGAWKWIASAVVIIVLSLLLKKFGQQKLTRN